ncbi:5971_t:CDS:2, partial [Ambispora gerdemannii]
THYSLVCSCICLKPLKNIFMKSFMAQDRDSHNKSYQRESSSTASKESSNWSSEVSSPVSTEQLSDSLWEEDTENLASYHEKLLTPEFIVSDLLNLLNKHLDYERDVLTIGRSLQLYYQQKAMQIDGSPSLNYDHFIFGNENEFFFA